MFNNRVYVGFFRRCEDAWTLSTMPNITLDINCIIDLEQGNARAAHLKRLLQMHNDEKINLRVVAISASERKPNGTYLSNLIEFRDRIAPLGLAELEILPTICYIGLSFVGHCLIGGDASSELERKIQSILFPTIEVEYSTFCEKQGVDRDNPEARRKWRNSKCDVLALWSHIWHNGDIFITSDKNFHKKTKKVKLISLGAGRILRPREAVRFLTKARV